MEVERTRKNEALLGLSITAKDAQGIDVKAGDDVLIRGRILRIHPSGFSIVEIHGPEPQVAVLVHARNVVAR